MRAWLAAELQSNRECPETTESHASFSWVGALVAGVGRRTEEQVFVSDVSVLMKTVINRYFQAVVVV